MADREGLAPSPIACDLRGELNSVAWGGSLSGVPSMCLRSYGEAIIHDRSG